ncbi:MAG: TcpE family conjugal transfer membrane protein, partial [Streptosporangiaceae bacterium]
MDLPTYTNVWRIEKRLYKLYDLRLPMPLPLVTIGVYAGAFLPWIVLLQFLGVPFATPWHVLYLVPPGVLAWLATRPVIEGKRLTELLQSHGRYVAEPRTWCRLTPIREPREVFVVARVWRSPAQIAPRLVAVRKAAAVPTPRPATAAAPQPLSEYAAEYAAAHAGAVARMQHEMSTQHVLVPDSILREETLVREAPPQPEQPRRPAIVLSGPAADVPVARSRPEPLPVTPTLEVPPQTPEAVPHDPETEWTPVQTPVQTPGKRAPGSGVRSPGESAVEFRQAVPGPPAPADLRATPQPDPVLPAEPPAVAAPAAPRPGADVVPAEEVVPVVPVEEPAALVEEPAAEVEEAAAEVERPGVRVEEAEPVVRAEPVVQADSEGVSVEPVPDTRPDALTPVVAESVTAESVTAESVTAEPVGSVGEEPVVSEVEPVQEGAAEVAPPPTTVPDIPQVVAEQRPAVGPPPVTAPDIPQVPGSFGQGRPPAEPKPAQRRWPSEPARPAAQVSSPDSVANRTDAQVWPPVGGQVPAAQREQPPRP